MNRQDTTPLLSAALEDPMLIRHADRATLAHALQDARHHTMARFDELASALAPSYTVPKRAVLNPPLWELGHIGWFQEWWIERNSQRAHGRHADPLAARSPSICDFADVWYNSSTVEHASRWTLPLLDIKQTHAYLRTTLEQTLARLAHTPNTDADLYFYRLCLAHEDMHAEAFSMMAHEIEAISSPTLSAPSLPTGQLHVAAHRWLTGSGEHGFSFDNERGEHEMDLGGFEIDSTPVSRELFARFLRETNSTARADAVISAASSPQSPITHVTHIDAQDYCEWAGRRLPTEHEWEAAQHLHGDQFAWGQAWEWTASVFTAYPGFTSDPYQDYSKPWFGEHIVLKGGSGWSRPRMRHARYRNFFLPHRVDVLNTFRTVKNLD